MKYGIPIISVDFIDKCVADMKHLDPEPFLLSETVEAQQFSSGKIVCKYHCKFIHSLNYCLCQCLSYALCCMHQG